MTQTGAVDLPDLDHVDLHHVDLERLRRQRGAKWSKYPTDVLPAWVADMDFPTAPPVRAVLQESIDLDDHGYASQTERDAVVDAFVDRMADRHGWRVEPTQVEVMTDVLQAVIAVIDRHTAPGDGVVMQTPIYPPFIEAVPETGRTRVDNPLLEGEWALDTEGLGRVVDERTRVVLLSNPHNPTGRVFTRRELDSVADVAARCDLVVIADEIHADLVYEGNRHIPFATLNDDAAARTVTLTSATKAYNLGGLRTAVAVFGSDDLHERFRSIPRHLLGGYSTFGLRATNAAWRKGQPWLDAVMDTLDANRRLLGELLAERLPSIGYRIPEETYLAWLDCRQLDLPRPPAGFFLDEARVGLYDGAEFGPGGDGFVRLNFATAPGILDELVDRMAAAVARQR